MSDVGVYIHVPFCERVCPYCDFAVVAARTLPAGQERRYVDAILSELERRRGDFAGRPLASVYLGGGTPSLLEPSSIERLLAGVQAAFPGPRPAEVTLEVNPSTVERGRLPGFRAAGVGRVSVGIQSFDDTSLRRLGRAHRAVEGQRTLDACREAGFEDISLDLIVGAPGQDAAGLVRDLEATQAFGPDHVSAYELTLERGTPFYAAAERGRLALPDEDLAIELLERVATGLGAAGYRRYEISSYALPGREAQHNRRYWERRPVLGLGMGAVSSDPAGPGQPFGARRANPRSLDAYLSCVAGVAAPEVEIHSEATARGEAVFLALRTREGLDASRFAAEFGALPRAHYGEEIDALCAAGLLEESPDEAIRLTARGRMLSDSVFAQFV